MRDTLEPSHRSAIERACTALTIEYARCVDFRDYDNIVNVFTEDATLVVGTPLEGRSVILDAMMQRPGDLRSRHVISNGFVDIIDDGHARGICYLTLYRHRGPESLQPEPVVQRPPAAVGHYEDTFVQTTHGWRIGHRVLHLAFRDPEQFG